MKLQTPTKFDFAFYAGIDTRTSNGDEMIGISVWKFYIGIYPTRTGFEVSYGILNNNGVLE